MSKAKRNAYIEKKKNGSQTGVAEHRIQKKKVQKAMNDANAKVEVAKGEVETALTLLRGLPAESPHYHAARKVLAGLYLEHRNDKRMYCMTIEEMAAANPTVIKPH